MSIILGRCGFALFWASWCHANCYPNNLLPPSTVIERLSALNLMNCDCNDVVNHKGGNNDDVGRDC